MIVFLIACVASFIPFIALFLWLRSRRKSEEEYRSLCNKTLVQGFLVVFPVVLFSAVCHILLNLTGFRETNPLLHEALHNFIVLAFSEELMKFLAFKRVLKKNDYPYSWVDVTIIMTIVGIGFGVLESVIYAVGASVPVVLVRGICVPHAGYGFLVGYFYGKSQKNGQPGRWWIGFLLAWLIHGLYDFSLSDEFMAVNDNLVVIPLLLAALDIALVIMLIVFVRKAKTREEYSEPLSLQK